MKTFNLHFGGFYYSVHEQLIDNMLEGYFFDDETQEEGDYYSLDINYRLIFAEYSKEYLQALAEVLRDERNIDIDFIFESVISPREYNFETDTIQTSINDKDFKKLEVFKTDSDFIEFVDDASKSRSGFISFYDGHEAVFAKDEIFLSYLSKYLDSEHDQDVLNELDQQCIYEL
ncbi:MAG: hypothetical protein GY823_13440, partial [Flavobacteriaceae bacterium]|nr:hypothetical protein [Flavobacteriaceae bacterium]